MTPSLFGIFENLVQPFSQQSAPVQRSGVLPYLWASTKGFRPYIAGLIALKASVGALEATLFAVLGQVVDWLTTTPRGSIWALHQTDLMMLGGLILAIPGISALQTLLKHQTLSGNLPARLRWQFHRQLLDQDVAFFKHEMAGRIADRLMNVARATKDCWTSLIELCAFVAVYLLAMLSISASLDIRLMLPFVIWLMAYAALVYHAVPRMERASCAEAQARADSLGHLVDAYSHVQTVKIFDQQGAEHEQARASMSSHLRSTRAHERQVSAFVVINQGLGSCLLLSVASLALLLWNDGHLGVGGVAAACAIALRLTTMSQWLLWEASAVFEDIGTIRDGLGTVSRRSEMADASLSPALSLSDGEILFDRVTFAYAGEAQVLRAFSLRVKPGEHIAIVGASGSGKSSIFNLLLRLHEPQDGAIYIDGQDISAVQQASLRQSIGIVAQDVSLLHRSAWDNISYGRQGATFHQVTQASRLAHAHGFIEALQDSHGASGYDATVGERGSLLSGGQRQRVAIARAVLRDAPILLLDEATSALDAELEQAVLGGMSDWMRRKTVLAITHRLASAARMDRIIVLDEGRIAEEGTHAELLKRGGQYARLWDKQARVQFHSNAS